ncbi:arabinosylfuranosidase ArfA [Asticcacaulis endophyticus]|uniref:non-reducing end alpha-L-arabinofuranosidase n=1 Tax=Asticcacaulis endophyticus TaxID=1395890 RepID=A0A918Q915_9CAUL|nr:alpha-N-arabinofuranosidase [Asticcacaulis endophyticus]GGZ38504.1 intracellular exo-alpha-(1->5)-L-arabinofuranosidase 1 [Asticcacaulis endophyticus]
MTLKATVIADADFVISKLDRRLFGTFVEHMGRCVYGGIYEPGHPTADANGFRQDVMALTRELGPTIVRYPGGNFLSGYDWEDGVGPKENRPIKLDLAWHSTETNEFGTNEFMVWCKEAGVQPMFAVNLGTRGPDEARHFLEYCNHPGGTYYSDLRISHGFTEPHNIKFWCLGNEMDGPWQTCAKTAHEYGRIAQETGKVMKWVDPSIELTACGSSQRLMPTYGKWEYEVLDTCFDQVDYISLHHYMRNDGNDIKEFFAEIEALDYFITEVAAIADAVAASRRSTKRIMLSLDEWNVWYKAHTPDDLKKPGWPKAPPLLEEIYNFEDALVVGGALIVMINHADRLKAGCLAQLVNVIGPIMTETGGPAWRQTIFHPIADCTRLGHGEVLRLKVDTTTFETKSQGDIPHLLTAAVRDPQTGHVAIYALNRSTEDAMELDIDLRGMGAGLALVAATELHHADLKIVNTKDNEVIKPVPNGSATVKGSRLTAQLKPQSWNVFAIETQQ